MRNLGLIFKDLEDSLSGMSDEQSKATLLQLGFADKSVATIQLLIGMSDKIKEYEKALRSAGGATQEVSDKSLTPFQKAWARLSGSVIQFGVALTPVITVLAVVIEKIADLFDLILGRNFEIAMQGFRRLGAFLTGDSTIRFEPFRREMFRETRRPARELERVAKEIDKSTRNSKRQVEEQQKTNRLLERVVDQGGEAALEVVEVSIT